MLQDSSYGSGSEPDLKEHVSLASRADEAPRSSNSTFVTIANKASGRGVQTICAPTHQDVDVRHEGNKMSGNGTQSIGTVISTVELVNQKENVRGEKRFFFHTKGNTVRDAFQQIFAPQQQTSDIVHEENISEDHATQHIGKDPNMPVEKKFHFGWSKKSEGQRQHGGK